MFLLKELCAHPTGPEVERAWTAIKVATEGFSDKVSRSDGHLWKRVERLMAKAEAERLKALAEQQDSIPSDAGFMSNQPFLSPEDGLPQLGVGPDGLNSLNTHHPGEIPGESSFLSAPDIPAAEDALFIAHPEPPGYSEAGFRFHGENSAMCSANPGFVTSHPFGSPAAATDHNSLDWVMLDDMAQAVSQRAPPDLLNSAQGPLQDHRNSDEFLNNIVRGTDWM